ncbi:CopG family transcriptional regulator [Thiohalorhabdus sp.]|uniref:ribbon-helix-helix domain-containing protein n=1 Tax=Thiohalorhabdus sp. TaxID=3094134 RepID=UPI002FC34189
MTTLTIRLPNDKAERLKALAKSRGVSVNKLMEEMSTQALTEWDVESRFRAMAARADSREALAVLDRLDRADESG